MKIIVAGAGVGGYHIASMLSKGGHSVVVVDQSETALDSVRRNLDVKTVVGSGSNPRVLREADASNADLLIAFTASDETNMVACIMAKALGTKRTVARVRSPEYSGYLISPKKSAAGSRRVITPESLGISLLVNPDMMAAEEIMGYLPGFQESSVNEFAGQRIEIRELRVESDMIVNRKVRELELAVPCSIAGIIRPQEVLVPARDIVLQKDDHVLIVSSPENMEELELIFGHTRRKPRRVVILGAEHVGFRLAQLLERRGIGVKLVDPDTTRCQQAAAQLSKVEVVQGEGTDSDFLIEQGVPSADTFIAATGHDELNILAALLAMQLGAGDSVALVERMQYVSLGEAIGLDAVVSPLSLAAGGIARLVRPAAVATVSFIAGSRIEAIEFVVGETVRIANQKLAELPIPQGAVMAAIVRGDSIVFPQADTVVRPGDHVVAVCIPSAVGAVEKLFE